MNPTESLRHREEKLLFPTYLRQPVAIVDGQGCRLTDAEGRTYLDFLAGLAVNALGCGHPALTAALQQACGSVWHASNLVYTEPQLKLAERLVHATGMERAFFCNSGAEAVEAALKLARRHGGPERSGIVAAEGGFHGRTLGALSATASPGYREPFAPLVPNVTHVPFGDEAALEEAVTATTAAVLLEAVQGEGGVRPAPPGYLMRAREICDARGALLVLDEIQSGMGRTGTFLAVERYGVLPDVVCLAKALAGGLPMGVMLARGAASGALRPGDHGSTFGGGPLVSRVALAVLDEIQRPGFLESVNQVGAILGRGLGAAAAEAPGVAEVRGAGMMWGVELREERAQDAVDDLRARGVLACSAGPRVLRLLPPLILTAEEAEEGLQAVAATLKKVGS